MEAAVALKVEFVMITPRGGGPDSLPLFLRDPQVIERSGQEVITGALVDGRGVVLNRDFAIARRKVRRACRAIRHESGVLVPV